MVVADRDGDTVPGTTHHLNSESALVVVDVDQLDKEAPLGCWHRLGQDSSPFQGRLERHPQLDGDALAVGGRELDLKQVSYHSALLGLVGSEHLGYSVEHG